MTKTESFRCKSCNSVGFTLGPEGSGRCSYCLMRYAVNTDGSITDLKDAPTQMQTAMNIFWDNVDQGAAIYGKGGRIFECLRDFDANTDLQRVLGWLNAFDEEYSGPDLAAYRD